MPKVKSQPFCYFNRDLSWLSFNYRVLLEAADEAVPLYERIKFLAIYTANLEEFFRVRVAVLNHISRSSSIGLKKRIDVNSAETIRAIHEVVARQHEEFERIFNQHILPGLQANGIILYGQEPLVKEHQQEMVNFFKSKLLSYLQPVFLHHKKGQEPFLENDVSYLLVSMTNKQSPTNEPAFVYLNIPTKHLGRFVRFSSQDNRHYFMFLEDVVRRNLSTIFPGFQIEDCFSIKMDRSGELNIEDEFSGDLVEKLKQQLPKRQIGTPTRFIYDNRMNKTLLDSLIRIFKLHSDDAVPGGNYQNLDDLMKLPNPRAPQLAYTPLPAIGILELERNESLLEAISRKDRILHFPYHSYDYVLRFFNEAAIDPNVREIKVTLYRIASNSLIANALISAAKNGKQVTVFVEVKARFDEANNLRWAEEMQRAGVHIIYSIPGLKVHAKIALVRRLDSDGKLRGYAYLGTGNFNERTAEIYADHGLFTTHPGIVKELQKVFDHLGGKKIDMTFKHLLVAQFNLQQRFLDMLDREIQWAKKGKSARVIIKLNNLEDEVMINKLYEANAAGVSIELIIRGICCLIPAVEGLSEHIRVTRIVDRFLEHARVFWFLNNGKSALYLSSADWMKRNLYKRIEVGFPIYEEGIHSELKQMLDFQLQDNQKATRLDSEQNNLPVALAGEPPLRAQIETYEWLKAKQKNGGE